MCQTLLTLTCFTNLKNSGPGDTNEKVCASFSDRLFSYVKKYLFIGGQCMRGQRRNSCAERKERVEQQPIF